MTARIAVLAAAVFMSACTDRVMGPPGAPTIVVENPIQWSGNPVRLRSPAFDANSFIRVVIAGEEFEATLVAPQVVEFVLPALFSGRYQAGVRVERSPAALFAVEVVGLAGPPEFFTRGLHSNAVWALPTPRGEVLISEDGSSPQLPTGGYGVANLISGGPVVPIPGLEQSTGFEVKFDVPGPSFRSDHYVFDLSGPTPLPQVWRLRPRATPIAVLSCGLDGFSRTVAEVSEDSCLETHRRSRIIRNGSEILWEHSRVWSTARFHMAPGGVWTVPLVTLASPNDELATWPVFDSDARLSYEIDRYAHVSGAAFSADGSDLFVAALTKGDQAGWRIERLDAASGRALRSLEFPGAFPIMDVLADDVQSRLYAIEAGASLVLHVMDLETLELLASVPAPDVKSWYVPWGVMTAGGSANQVHFVPTGIIDRGMANWTFDLK